MNEKHFQQILIELEARRVPEPLELWPELEAEIIRLSRQQGRRQVIKLAFNLSFVFLAVILLLVALSPGLQGAAAQVIRDIGVMVGISGDAKGPRTFSPVPPFTVHLPGYLPTGFEYGSAQYTPGGDNLPSIREEVIRPGTATVEPAIPPSIPRDLESQPSILIRYAGNSGQFFELFQRSAQPGEDLPAGETFSIHGNTARLHRDEEKVTLTWIEAGTWIDLTGKLPEDELLKIAAGLEVTQTPQDITAEPQVVLDRQAAEATERAAFCNPADYVPDGATDLGDVPNQKRKGSLRIDLFYEDQYPFPATVAWGSSVENHADEVFKPALEALRDPPAQMTFLPYKAIGMYVNEIGCMEPNPAVRGYYIIEVWEKQVNMGYGGEALSLRERAIQAVEEELERVR